MDDQTKQDLEFKKNMDSLTADEIYFIARDIKNKREHTFKINHDAIVDSMTPDQWFKWHYNFFNGNLDYKSMARSIYHSTRSKKIRANCMVAIEYYDSQFGTSGFDLKTDEKES